MKNKFYTLILLGALISSGFLAFSHPAFAGDDYGWGIDTYSPDYSGGGWGIDTYYPDYSDFGYNDGWGIDTYYPEYSDLGYNDCYYDCGGYSYDYDNCCDYYGSDSGYYDDCCSYDYGYGDYCCSYGGGYSTPSYYPSYSYPSQSQSQSQSQHQSVVVNNSNTNNNSNVNNNNIHINTGGGSNTTPPPQNNEIFVDCFGSPSNPDEDENVTWTANASGGTGGYSYSWSGSNGLSGNSRTVHKSYSSSGVKTATVHVTSGNQKASATCEVDVGNGNNNDLDVYCVGSPSNPDIDETVRWTAYASGGDGDYEYDWSGDVNGDNRTESESYDDSGTKNARIRVTSDGDTATDECEVRVQPRGSTISNITVYEPPTGTPSSGVFLSQIPATGISPTFKLALFLLGMALWSAFGAYMILERRRMASLATVGVGALEVEGTEAEEGTVEEASEVNVDNDLENDLSFRARQENVLISRDGLEAVITRANGDQVKAENILSQLVSKVTRNEGDYATLNAEKINKLLS